MPNYTLINEKLLEVAIAGEEVYSKKGAMVAFTGDIAFARSFLAGGGVQDIAMRQVTNEAFRVMTARGHGHVYYAYHGAFVLPIALAGETMYIESESLLAFDGRLRTGTAFLGNQGLVQGVARGMTTGQGLFTTTLEGHGELAILSEGNAIGLEVTGNTPIFVDPDAYLGHKGQVESKVMFDVNWKSFLGQTSGESYQLKFTGNGTVYIQPSER
jgi:uncharacterized protein (AIM24 family)